MPEIDEWNERSRNLAETLVEASPDALLAISESGEILFRNAGAEAIFGYPRDEALGRSIFEITVPPESRS